MARTALVHDPARLTRRPLISHDEVGRHPTGGGGKWREATRWRRRAACDEEPEVPQRRPRKSPRDSGSVRKLPSGRWQARIYDRATGQRSAVGVFRAKAGADAALAVALRDQLHGTWARPELGRITLAAWSERWFDTKQGKRPKTRAFYRHVLDRYVLPELGGYRLARIDASLLRKWVAGLEATGLSPTTVGHAYSVCKQVLDSAVEARYLAASPAVIKGLRSRIPAALDVAECRAGARFGGGRARPVASDDPARRAGRTAPGRTVGAPA